MRGRHFRIGANSAIILAMNDLSDIKRSIEKLPPDDVVRLRDWLDELEGQLLDQRIEDDSKAGRLDKLAKRALAEHSEGRTREL